jgi:hypothetical protein
MRKKLLLSLLGAASLAMAVPVPENYPSVVNENEEQVTLTHIMVWFYAGQHCSQMIDMRADELNRGRGIALINNDGVRLSNGFLRGICARMEGGCAAVFQHMQSMSLEYRYIMPNGEIRDHLGNCLTGSVNSNYQDKLNNHANPRAACGAAGDCALTQLYPNADELEDIRDDRTDTDTDISDATDTSDYVLFHEEN